MKTRKITSAMAKALKSVNVSDPCQLGGLVASVPADRHLDYRYKSKAGKLEERKSTMVSRPKSRQAHPRIDANFEAKGPEFFQELSRTLHTESEVI